MKIKDIKCIPHAELSYIFFMGYRGFASLQVRPQQVRLYYDQLSPSSLCLSYLWGFPLINRFLLSLNHIIVRWAREIHSFFYNSKLSLCAPKPLENKKIVSFMWVRLTAELAAVATMWKKVEGLRFEDHRPIVFPFDGLMFKSYKKDFFKDKKVNYCNFSIYCINNIINNSRFFS